MMSEKKNHTLIQFSLKIIKKGVIYRTSIVSWESSEVLQKTFILFDTDVLKIYKFPNFEQTDHLELDIVKSSRQPVKMQVYQEFVILNSNSSIVIIDGVSHKVIKTLEIGYAISLKLHRTEISLFTLLMEENMYFLLASASGSVLMVCVPSEGRIGVNSDDREDSDKIQIGQITWLRQGQPQEVPQLQFEVKGLVKASESKKHLFKEEMNAMLVFDCQNIPMLFTKVKMSVRVDSNNSSH